MKARKKMQLVIAAAVIHAVVAADFSYEGCYRDSYIAPILTEWTTTPSAANSVEACMNDCLAYKAGYKWFGIENSQAPECWCGVKPNYDEAVKNPTGCTAVCKDDSKHTCGGDGTLMSLYSIEHATQSETAAWVIFGVGLLPLFLLCVALILLNAFGSQTAFAARPIVALALTVPRPDSHSLFFIVPQPFTSPQSLSGMELCLFFPVAGGPVLATRSGHKNFGSAVHSFLVVRDPEILEARCAKFEHQNDEKDTVQKSL